MSADEIDNELALRIAAELLVESLDLRRECWPEVLAEVRRERDLVFWWLRQQGAAADARG